MTAKRKKKNKKIWPEMVVIAILVVLFLALSIKPDPVEFVEERTVESQSDLFFRYDIIKYPTHVEIIDTPQPTDNISIGFNVGSDSIDFGTIFKTGSSSKRQINLSSRDGLSSNVNLKAFGPIKDMIEFSDNDFIFSGKRSVFVILKTGNIEPGNYTGEVDITIQRSKYEFLNSLLGY